MKNFFSVIALSLVLAGCTDAQHDRDDVALLQRSTKGLPAHMILQRRVEAAFSADKTQVVISSSGREPEYIALSPKSVAWWSTLLDAHAKGGDIYFYDSDERDGKGLAGSRGYILIRDGHPVESVLTFRN